LLKLRKNLYGLKDAGRTWYEHIRDGLIRQGFKISAVDPCLFTKEEVILILYVDDAVIIFPDQEAITRVVKSLEKGFALTDEGPIRDYLGIRVEKLSDGRIMLVQRHMIDRCLELVGIPVDQTTHTKTHDTPACEILHKDPQGGDRKHSWNYHAIVGALTYLMAMTRPELAYAVHQCSRFSNDPKQSHE